MIGGVRRDRLWAGGGALVAVLLVALTFFLLVGPQQDRTGEFNRQTVAAGKDAQKKQERIADLRKQNEKLDEYRAKRETDRKALPETAGMSDFLRELQSTATSTGVTVTTLIVGAAAPVATTPGVFAVPLTLTITSNTASFPLFLDRMQRVEPRAVLVGSVSIVPAGTSEYLGGQVTLTITMQAFVAPPAAAATTPTEDDAAANAGTEPGR